MRRVSALLLGLFLVVLSGCGAADSLSDNVSDTQIKPQTSLQEELTSKDAAAKEAGSEELEHSKTETVSGILVVYFSRTGEQYTVGVIDHGNTAIVAEMIAEDTGADLFEVLPADDHYPMT